VIELFAAFKSTNMTLKTIIRVDLGELIVDGTKFCDQSEKSTSKDFHCDERAFVGACRRASDISRKNADDSFQLEPRQR